MVYLGQTLPAGTTAEVPPKSLLGLCPNTLYVATVGTDTVALVV